METIIPDPEGLVKAVAQARVLHAQKLSGEDLRFLRSALEMQSKAMASLIDISPEHMSRLEAGTKVITAHRERLVRIFTFVRTLRFTSKRQSDALELGKIVENVFSEFSIKPCRLAEKDLVLVLSRVRNMVESNDGDNGTWDYGTEVAA